MTRFTLFAFALIAFSCGSTDSEDSASSNVLEDISFSIDTVVVNPGEELINLQWGLGLADITADKKKLYLLDGTSQSLFEVDLDGLKLLRKIQFEKEGPNGIGTYPGGFQILSDGNFLISGFQGSAIFSPSKEKIRDIKFLAGNIDSLSKDLENGAYFGLLASQDSKHFLSLPGNFFDGTRDLLVADFSSVKGKMIDIPAMDIASELRIVLKSAEAMMVAAENLEIQDLNGRAVISSSATSDIYLYDYSSDSLRLVNYQHRLVPGKKEPRSKSEVSSQEEFQVEWAKLQEQIGFEKFFWDDKNLRYYRFGKISQPKVDDKTPRKADVFLFAYDKEFKMIGETQLKDLTSVPAYPFFKNGKLWSYVNVEDELGFAVIDFKF
ncbi:protein of unknown function [Algoriphagus alkaliphilus]|uniref:DUF4221 domain-containing protein n=1 Tax=Algoriphagus alkaliphilus TaxID=279824 RepID=A0A1G5ZM97_9BACT|nr:DUF4221 family protein [Algoriphagus alkaliphilus]MBA4302021.1 DUF4221 domain-containing protein [Cyclobacterium sp.]SDA95884.1 protein of unknown function [Algoriphagus alkaliphilus]